MLEYYSIFLELQDIFVTFLLVHVISLLIYHFLLLIYHFLFLIHYFFFLFHDDYYFVVNINSNAATEAIWAGIPAITLDKHITNPVTKNQLSDINDLLRPNLSLWLCALSYSQFTFDELIDGTAARIIKKYHV